MLFSHKKERNLAICNIMDGPWGHHIKWNVSKRKSNTVWYHFYVESKNKQRKWKLINAENRLTVAKDRCGEMGKMAECTQKVQTSNYKADKSWGCNVQHGDCSSLHCCIF